MLKEALEWRYATNIFDTQKKVDEETLAKILEAANLSPTSFGIQAYKILVLNGEKWKEKLTTATFNQENIQTCSHLLILCSITDLDTEYVDEYMDLMEDVRDLEDGRLDRYGNVIKQFIGGLEATRRDYWLSHQVYLVAGTLLTACAVLKVDACPMEGFNAKSLDVILGLKEKNLQSVLLIPIGYRSVSDKYATAAKVRKPLKEMVIQL